MSATLPPNWEWIPLGEYLENHDAARVPISSKEREKRHGAYPYYGASGIIDQIDGFTHEGEYLLLGEDGANLLTRSKPIAFLARGQFWVNNHAHVLRCKGEAPNAYVAYYLNSIDLSPYVTGTAQPKLSQAKMNKIPIPVAPLDQQKHIVAEIEKQFSRLDEAVANLKRVKANLKRYKAAVLKAAVEGRLVETEAEIARREGRNYETGAQLLQRILETRRSQWKGKGKYKEPAAPDTTDLSELPEGWVWATLEQLCPIFVDSAHRTPKYGTAGFPAVGPRDVVGGTLRLDIARVVSDDEFAIQTERRIPQPSDIVYSRELSLGWGAIVPDGAKICLSQGMCLFRPDERVSLSYFVHSLNGPEVRKQATSGATGSAHPHLNLGEIKELRFTLPPRSEQDRIVAEVDRRLSLVREAEAQIDANLTRAERMRQSILQNAFSGRLVQRDVVANPKAESGLLMAADASGVYKKSVRAKPSA